MFRDSAGSCQAAHCLQQGEWGMCASEKGGFEAAFFIFVLRVGVGCDAAADSEAECMALNGKSTDRDVEACTAIRREVSDSAGVDVAALRLELADDLHG